MTLLTSAVRKESDIAHPEYFHATIIQTGDPGGRCPRKELDGQAKAMGHQGSPLTGATSDAWDRPTLVYRLSCPGYFTTEPEPLPSADPDSTDELTCSSTRQRVVGTLASLV